MKLNTTQGHSEYYYHFYFLVSVIVFLWIFFFFFVALFTFTRRKDLDLDVHQKTLTFNAKMMSTDNAYVKYTNPANGILDFC